MKVFFLAWDPSTGLFERFLVFLFSNDIVDADLVEDKQVDMKTRKH